MFAPVLMYWAGIMNQTEFARIFCERPESFAWFLGAGASRNANLPTAEDVITDLKRRYYCSEENQNFSTKDLQNDAVRAQIEGYLRSRGFPERWSAEEYTTYFETIFGEDRERQTELYFENFGGRSCSFSRRKPRIWRFVGRRFVPHGVYDQF